MKKLVAILLALMMVLVSVAALAGSADEEPTDANILKDQDPTKAAEYKNENDKDDPNNGKYIGTASAPVSVTIDKLYVITGDNTAVMPAHTLTFSVDQVPDGVSYSTSGKYPANDPSVDPISVPAGYDPNTDDALPMVIKIPAYTEPGVYTYTITENDGTELDTPHTVAGVQYITKNYELKITIVEGSALAAGGISASGLVVGGVALREENSNTKIAEITNEYIAGSVTVGKTVTGNLGDRKRPFSFTMTFTADEGVYVDGPIAYTLTNYAADGTKSTEDKILAGGWTGTKAAINFQLAHGDTITFTNIPKGVTYTVDETDKNANGYTTTVPGNNTGKIANANGITVTYINDKNIVIDTGVSLDSAVYMLIMALALAGFVVLKIRRREDY